MTELLKKKLKKSDTKKVNKLLLESLESYRTTLSYMSADAPIGVLCLPAVMENALIEHGCLRVYDLFNCDFTKIKGFGESRVRQLTARLDQFFFMS